MANLTVVPSVVCFSNVICKLKSRGRNTHALLLNMKLLTMKTQRQHIVSCEKQVETIELNFVNTDDQEPGLEFDFPSKRWKCMLWRLNCVIWPIVTVTVHILFWVSLMEMEHDFFGTSIQTGRSAMKVCYCVYCVR